VNAAQNIEKQPIRLWKPKTLKRVAGIFNHLKEEYHETVLYPLHQELAA
jgi:hypothetical protein